MTQINTVISYCIVSLLFMQNKQIQTYISIFTDDKFLSLKQFTVHRLDNHNQLRHRKIFP